MNIVLVVLVEVIVLWLTFCYLPWLFAIVGILGMGFMDYWIISHIAKTWPPQTFENGVEIFCLMPFFTFGLLGYIIMFYLSVAGQLYKNENRAERI